MEKEGLWSYWEISSNFLPFPLPVSVDFSSNHHKYLSGWLGKVIFVAAENSGKIPAIIYGKFCRQILSALQDGVVGIDLEKPAEHKKSPWKQ